MKEVVSGIILQKYKKRPLNVVPLQGGEIAHVFKVVISVGKEVCIKFDNFSEERSRMKMEWAAMKKLRKIGVDTPTPLHIGTVTRPDHSRQEYLIMSFEQGELLSTQWSQISSQSKKEMAGRLLRILNLIGRVKTTGFGHLTETLSGTHPTFSDYIKEEIETFRKSDVKKILSESVWKSAKKSLIRHSSGKVKPSFVHADYRLRNFIVNGSKLVLFDFANALSSDRVFDFVRFMYTDFSEGSLDSKDAQWIKKLYLSQYYDGNNYEYDESIYKLLLTFRLSPWYLSNNKRVYLKRTLAEMEKLSTILSG